ncbi:hypothetical protein N657DRAFT_180317 [Parathielavia appendiculata]|uniref:Uncharacterized protein n=1 Tax=Parathielavia appendiculata TaxID=2587402 RepID=A0AAN6U606_9PEZI|nr:hypothetical protein N657DRAFT_180317 [Parathielavia appendiculata]
MTPLKQALTLHLLTEVPASLSFLLAPHAQLLGASPEATLILRNLGGLLMATNLVCLAVLLAKPPSDDRLTARLCLCLGTYHVWPIARAWVRMRLRRGAHEGSGSGSGGGGVREEKKVLGGPVVHFVVHVICLLAMVGSGGMVLLRE